MTPERKTEFRWQFAGQAMAGLLAAHATKYGKYEPRDAIKQADLLIAALEASTVKGECEHEWARMPVDRTNISDTCNWVGPEHCHKCGAMR